MSKVFQQNTQQQVDYAKYVLNHDVRDEVIDKITMKILRSFQNGSQDMREEAARTMDSLELFFGELQSIVNNDLDVNGGDE